MTCPVVDESVIAVGADVPLPCSRPVSAAVDSTLLPSVRMRPPLFRGPDRGAKSDHVIAAVPPPPEVCTWPDVPAVVGKL